MAAAACTLFNISDSKERPAARLRLQVQFWDPPTGGPSRPQLFGKLSRPHPFGYLLYKPAAPGAAAEAAQPYKTFNVTRIGGEVAAQKLAALWPLASDLAGPTSTARGEWACSRPWWISCFTAGAATPK